MTRPLPPEPGHPLLLPDLPSWSEHTCRHADHAPLSTLRSETRRALDLPAETPLLATGHQAMAWHPGILAKDIAIAEAARASEARHGSKIGLIHFVADQDANDGGLISYPRSVDGVVQRGNWRALPMHAGAATGDRPTAQPNLPPRDAALDSVQEGLDAIHAGLARHTSEANAANQLAMTMAELATPFTGLIPRRSMSGLLLTPIGSRLLEEIQRDPMACASAYDDALLRTQAETGAHRPVARMLAHANHAELPFWKITPEGRRTARADESLDPAALRPKALLATALVRLAGCDGFVHGMGGSIYDTAMEYWIESWLGEEYASALAPKFQASATLRLDLAIAPPSSDADPVTLHRLLHDPEAGEEDRWPSTTKQVLIQSIKDAPRGTPERARAFQALHDWIRQSRKLKQDQLAEFEAKVHEHHRSATTMSLAQGREWAFPFHDEASIRSELVAPIRRLADGREVKD